MIRRNNRQPAEPSAVRAVGHLIQIGILEIRTMATTHEVLAVGADADTESPYDTEYSARIHMIADVCHELTAAFLEDDVAVRESVAAAALSYRWSAAVPQAQRWMRSRLSQLGEDYLALLP